MKTSAFLVMGSLIIALATTIAGARPPFFNGAATSFDPEVSVVNTGVLNDVQATVSADRKYVTLGMRPANSQLLALREFSFQNGVNPRGQVGIGPAVPGAPAAMPTVLTTEGTFRVNQRGR